MKSQNTFPNFQSGNSRFQMVIIMTQNPSSLNTLLDTTGRKPEKYFSLLKDIIA